MTQEIKDIGCLFRLDFKKQKLKVDGILYGIHEKIVKYSNAVFQQNLEQKHTLRPVNDATEGSTQEAPMCASCVLPSVASLTGRSVLL